MTNIIKFFLYISKLIIILPFQIKKVKSFLGPIITDSENSHGAVDKRLINKGVVFGTILPHTVFKPYARLTNTKATTKDMEISILISFLTAPYDHYIDTETAQEKINELSEILESPNNSTPTTPTSGIISEVYKEILARIRSDRKTEYIEILKELHQVQLESTKQKNPGTPIKELRRISITKGGLSMLAYTLFFKDQSLEEQEILKSFGGWVQIADDYADYDRDVNNGIRTVFTEKPISKHKQVIKKESNKAFANLKKLPYSKKAIKKFTFSTYSFTLLGMTVYEQLRSGNILIKQLYKMGPGAAIFAFIIGFIYSLKKIATDKRL